MTQKRSLAILNGITIILMAFIGAYSIGFALSTFSQANPETLKTLIDNQQSLYKNMLWGFGFIIFLDVLVSVTLYLYFKSVSVKIATISSSIRLIYTLILSLASLSLLKNIMSVQLTNMMMAEHINNFEWIWNIGLTLFGFHIYLLGSLMKKSGDIPKTLWMITYFAGISYVILHLLKLWNQQSEWVTIVEMVLALPMALGELGLAVWLLFKGGRSKL